MPTKENRAGQQQPYDSEGKFTNFSSGNADKSILDKLHNIRADELEHIEILKSILEKL